MKILYTIDQFVSPRTTWSNQKICFSYEVKYYTDRQSVLGFILFSKVT